MFYWIIFCRNLLQKARDNKLTVILTAVLVLTFLPAATISLASCTVEVEVDGQVIRTTTCSKNVAQVLAENNIELGYLDSTEPALEAALQDGQVIRVLRSFPVRVLADQKETEVYVGYQTVGEVLKNSGIKMAGLDRVEPDLNTVVKPNDLIRVYRVEEKVLEFKEEVPPPVERTVDYSLERGIQRTVQRGTAGVIKETVKVILEDGKEILRETLSRQVVKEPVKRILAEGGLTSVSRGGQRIEFDHVIECVATAYSYSAGSRTSTGQSVRVGGVAVDPTVIPYGTRMYIENYGFATAIDCGGAIKGNRIDVFLESDKACKKWGVKKVKVYILR